ncbi:MAG: hypothetical protein WDO73_05615 [Ignavibacteriota bacterium]
MKTTFLVILSIAMAALALPCAAQDGYSYTWAVYDPSSNTVNG